MISSMRRVFASTLLSSESHDTREIEPERFCT
jgi:hypothetical protein